MKKTYKDIFIHIAQQKHNDSVIYLCIIQTCFYITIAVYYNQVKKPSTKRKEEKQMKTYKIYVNGMYVGTEDFTRSEVTAIESDQDIKLIEK